MSIYYVFVKDWIELELLLCKGYAKMRDRQLYSGTAVLVFYDWCLCS